MNDVTVSLYYHREANSYMKLTSEACSASNMSAICCLNITVKLICKY